jgi:CRISPR/Cas system Type II protein with McrA/HNH and RuvC-like nuclease domain
MLRLAICHNFIDKQLKDREVTIEIFRGFDWYSNRLEEEKIMKGFIKERQVVYGPNTRSALRYTLVTQDIQLPIYAANVEEKLSQFIDHKVLVFGKVVDLSNEDIGQELWIGSISTID